MTDELTNDFISTLSVQQFYFLNPDPKDILIADIAHSLSLICRFGGHCNVFYSVAEHSIILAKALEDEGADTLTVMAGLLHDAEEAYLPDITRPVKNVMPEAKKIYAILETAIEMKFHLQAADWERIKEMDSRLVVTEAKALGIWNEHWVDAGTPLRAKLYLWSSDEAKHLFLINFLELSEKLYDYTLR